jgi:hypothetical protein
LETIGSLTERIREYDRRLQTIGQEHYYPETELLRQVEGVGALTALTTSSSPFGSDSDLRRHGEKIASRGAKNAKKRAVVAVARKLSVLLHRLWVTGEIYEPLYNAHRRGDSAA